MKLQHHTIIFHFTDRSIFANFALPLGQAIKATALKKNPTDDMSLHCILFIKTPIIIRSAAYRLNVVCWSILNVFVANGMDPDQTASLDTVCMMKLTPNISIILTCSSQLQQTFSDALFS